MPQHSAVCNPGWHSTAPEDSCDHIAKTEQHHQDPAHDNCILFTPAKVHPLPYLLAVMNLLSDLTHGTVTMLDAWSHTRPAEMSLGSTPVAVSIHGGFSWCEDATANHSPTVGLMVPSWFRFRQLNLYRRLV